MIRNRGHSLVELLVAVSALLLLVGALHSVATSSERLVQDCAPTHSERWQLHVSLSRMTDEIRESRQGLIRVFAGLLPDPELADADAVLAFPSARDPRSGAFLLDGSEPDWKWLIVYAAFLHTSARRPALGRYSVAIPDGVLKRYLAGSGGLRARVEGGEIVLADGASEVRVPRSGEVEVVVEPLALFDVARDKGNGLFRLSLAAHASGYQGAPLRAAMTCGVRARN